MLPPLPPGSLPPPLNDPLLALSVPELREFVESRGSLLEARQREYEAKAVRMWLKLVCLPLAAGVGGAIWGLRPNEPGLVALVVIVAFSLAYVFRRPRPDYELRNAAAALEILGEQTSRLEEALVLAAREPGITLFLRGFAVEAGVDSQRGLAFSDADRERDALEVSGGLVFPNLPFTGSLWTLQSAAIRALQIARRVVLLENSALEEYKDRELSDTGALVVPVVTSDWWDVFVTLAERSRVIVVFLDVLSPSLRREITHILERGRPYVLVCTKAMSARLSTHDDAVLRRIPGSASVLLTYSDPSDPSSPGALEARLRAL
jgi:hypothetical protein